MNNRKIAVIISIFIVVMLIVIGFMGIASRIPFVGRALALIFAVILIIFVILTVIISGRRKR